MVRTRTSAWLLNLDAEDELARPAGYTPSRATLARVAALAPRLRALLLPGDVLLPDAAPAPGSLGRAWCPTPRAYKAFQSAGVPPAAAPPLAVLRAVNHRHFSAALGQGLPGARYAFTPEEVAAALASPSPTGQWLLKRPFGYAGRGRLQVDPRRTGDLDRAQPWIRASLRGGEGLQVEPLVEREGDFALHGHLARGGRLVLGEPTRQDCDASGAWSATARAAPGDLSPEERRALLDEARRTAAALHEAGYFGPFGIDGFRWIGPSGERRFHARGEINARYSMGWATGMGDRRPDVEDDADEGPRSA